MAWENAPWTSPAVELATLIRINITWPSPHGLYFTDNKVFDDATYGTNNASVGHAATMRMAEISIGENGARHTIALRNVRPFEADVNLEYASDIGELMTKYAFHGATVMLYQYAEDQLTNSAKRTLLAVGKIEDITDITPASVTLIVVENQQLANSSCPYYTVGTISGYPDPPAQSKGLALASRLGPMFYIPKSMGAYGLTNTLARDLIPSGHARSSIVPARNLGTKFYRWGYQEKLEQTTTAYATAGLTPAAFQYIPELDSFAAFDNATYGGDAGSAFWHNFLCGPQQSMTAYLIPREWSYVDAGMVTNQEYALDRRMDTWMKVVGTGVAADAIRFKIPTIGNPGNLNTVVADAINIMFFTLGGTPPGEDNPATGSIAVSIKHPYGTVAQDASIFNEPNQNTVTNTGWQKVIRLGEPGYQYPRAVTWRGSRWARWDFTASASDNTGTPDDYFYPEDTDHGGAQQDIVIKLGVGATVAYILCVALKIRFIKDSQRFIEYKRRMVQRPNVPVGTEPVGEGETSRISGGQWDYVATGSGYHARYQWGTGRTEWTKDEEIPEEVVAPEGVWVWHPGYHDGTDAYGTGSTWITGPGAQIGYVAANYGDSAFTVGSSTTFGSIKYFDNMMTDWAKLHDATAPGFRLHWWAHDKSSVEDKIESILAELPGMARHSIGPTGARTLICTGTTMTPEVTTACHACYLEGLSVARDISRDSGVPQIELQPSPASGILNEIELHYQFDPATGQYGKIAKCSPGGSDDGYGLSWPNSLLGRTAAGLCSDSALILTNNKPRKKIIHLKYHWWPETVVALGCWYLWRYWRPYVIVRFVGELPCHDIMPGQLIRFNEDVRTVAGLNCVIPFRDTVAWKYANTVYWHVLSNRRFEDERGHQRHEIYAMEHLNTQTATIAEAMEGGIPEPGEGFDV